MLGSLTFFTGPMACGKTLELVRNLQIYAEQRVPTVCVRPARDTRSNKIESRSGLCYDGVTISEEDLDALRDILEKYTVIGLDEAQFFPRETVPLLHSAMLRGKKILVSGLDTDFRGDNFSTPLAIMALPETKIVRTKAVCAVCLEHSATRTQRLKNGHPVSRSEPTVEVEGADVHVTYEPRCALHHIVLD